MRDHQSGDRPTPRRVPFLASGTGGLRGLALSWLRSIVRWADHGRAECADLGSIREPR